jgi:hypothetical protein
MKEINRLAKEMTRMEHGDADAEAIAEKYFILGFHKALEILDMDWRLCKDCKWKLVALAEEKVSTGSPHILDYGSGDLDGLKIEPNEK